MTYECFLAGKSRSYVGAGLETSLTDVNSKLFDWQKALVQWSLKKGKAALFEDCGLGKTAQQLEWANQVAKNTQGDVLILAPLAVAEQTRREASKFGINAHVCRTSKDLQSGVNITNYDMLEHFDANRFAGVVLDESSILKSHTSRTREYITSAFANTPFRLACSATPSPNDYIELGTHAEFLGVMTRSEMLATFFTHDGGDTSKWVLKGHAAPVFWKWVSSWAVMIRKPSDIGYTDEGYNLPLIHRHQHVVESNVQVEGMLFTPDVLTLEERRDTRRQSLSDRVAKCAELVNGTTDQFLVWCDLNDESSALAAAIPGSVEVRGSDTREHKENSGIAFAMGSVRVLVSKPSIFGYGMNFQNCHNVAFVGLSDSFEQIYQAERRCWRFGQISPVSVHLITSDGDGPVVKNIERKAKQFEAMSKGMIEHMRDEMNQQVCGTVREQAEYTTGTNRGNGWTIHNGDCVEYVAAMTTESIDLTVFSPPFSSLYCYSGSDRDMGNSGSDEEFTNHFSFLVRELFRVTRPGRIVAFHCMNLPAMKERDGYIGVKDFRGTLIRMFQEAGFIFHSEHVIWKDPLVEATRTKAIGLMHKQLCKDSTMSRAGLPDYLIAMRKPGMNTKPVPHVDGLTSFAGENEPTTGTLSHERWRRYASPVWMDINQSRTLNSTVARDPEDLKHICPLQLDVIERAIELWSTKGDLVLSPFAGIGSEGYQAIRMERGFVGVELKPAYFNQAVKNLQVAESAGKDQGSLFETQTTDVEVAA